MLKIILEAANTSTGNSGTTRKTVEEAKELFGDIGALAAELHIRLDNDGCLPRKKDYEIPEYGE